MVIHRLDSSAFIFWLMNLVRINMIIIFVTNSNLGHSEVLVMILYASLKLQLNLSFVLANVLLYILLPH